MNFRNFVNVDSDGSFFRCVFKNEHKNSAFYFFKMPLLTEGLKKTFRSMLFYWFQEGKKLKTTSLFFVVCVQKKWNPTYRTHFKKMNCDVFWAECPHQLRETTLRKNNWAECPHQLRENTLSIKKKRSKNRFFELLVFFEQFGSFAKCILDRSGYIC